MRLATYKKHFPLPDDPKLPLAAGFAFEVDSNVTDALLVGANIHRCAICMYVTFHLLLVAFTFKLFVVPRAADAPEGS